MNVDGYLSYKFEADNDEGRKVADVLNYMLEAINSNRVNPGPGYRYSRNPQGTSLSIRPSKNIRLRHPLRIFDRSVDDELAVGADYGAVIDHTDWQAPKIIEIKIGEDPLIPESEEADPPQLSVPDADKSYVFLKIKQGENGKISEDDDAATLVCEEELPEDIEPNILYVHISSPKQHNMKVNVDVGAKLDSSFKSTLANASSAVTGMAGEISKPMAQIASGAKVSQIGLDMLKEAITSRLLGPLGALVVGVGGVNAALWLLDKSARLVSTSLGEFSKMEDLEAQFKPLLGSLSAARARLADLAIFAARTPFELPEIAQASKTLEVLTKGALATSDGLEIVGDTAAATNRPFTEMAMWVGRLYDGLMSGRPVGEAMMRMQELGLVSGETRTKIEALQKEGKAGAEVWKVVADELNRTKGSMDNMSQTASGLTSTLTDTRNALYRAIGESFIAAEKENIKETTKVLENLTPVAKEAGKILGDLGIVDQPSEWVPIFDLQLKQLLNTLLSAKDFMVGLVKVVFVLGSAFTAALTVSVVASVTALIGVIRRAMMQSQQWLALQKPLRLEWSLNTQSIVANTQALLANGAAGLRAQAGQLALNAATKVSTAVWRSFAGAIATVGRAFIGIPGIIAAAGAYIYSTSLDIKEQIRQMEELGKMGLDYISKTREEGSAVKTLEDKVKALNAAYERLKELKAAVAAAPTSMQRTIAEIAVQGQRKEISKIEGTDNSKLGMTGQAQEIAKQLADLQKKAWEEQADAAEKLAARQKELIELETQKANLSKNAAALQMAASAATLQSIDKEIAVQQKILQQSMERNAFDEGIAFSSPEKTARMQKEAEIQRLAREKIEALEGSKPGRQAAANSAQEAVGEKGNEIAAKGFEIDALQKEIVENERKNALKAEELRIEAQILALKSEGSQRTIDEIKLRQQLLASKITEAQAQEQSLRSQGKTNAAAEKVNEIQGLKNQYIENENRLGEANKSRDEQIAEARKARVDAKEQNKFDALPTEEKITALKEKQAKAEKEADDLMMQSRAARRNGEEGLADELELKSEKQGAEADKFGFSAEELAKKNQGTIPLVDSMQKIGGGGRVAALGGGSDPIQAELKTHTPILKEMAKSLKRLEEKDTGMGLRVR